MAEESRKKTRLMIAVNESKYAFEWTLDKIIGTNTAGFEIIIIHAEDGSDGPVLGDSTSDENANSPVEGLDVPVGGASTADEIDSDGCDRNEEAEKSYDPEIGWDDGVLVYFEERCSDMKISHYSRIRKGSPEEVIPNEANDVKPDLLILGSRNVPPDMRDIDIGPSVSDWSKRVKCPVLIVTHSA